jgi:hypothetical protein
MSLAGVSTLRFNRWSGRGIWQQIFGTVAGSPVPLEQASLDSTHVAPLRRQAIGQNSKIHGLADKLHRPWVLILTPANAADCTGNSFRKC